MREKLNQMNYQSFEGCFLTGTAAEITPISQIDKNNYKVCECNFRLVGQLWKTS